MIHQQLQSLTKYEVIAMDWWKKFANLIAMIAFPRKTQQSVVYQCRFWDMVDNNIAFLI